MRELVGFSRRVARHYDAVTVDYRLFGDNIHWGLYREGETATSRASHSAAAQRMTATVVEAARIDRTHTVVDAGCGIGTTSLYIAETYGCSVVGFNITESQLELARAKVAAKGLEERVRFELVDCSLGMPLDDESVDAIVTLECGVHLSDRPRFFAESARILKSGGVLSGEDWFTREGVSESDYARHIQPVCDAWVFPDIATLGDYSRLLREAGLEVLEREDFGARVLENVRTLATIERLARLPTGLQNGHWSAMAPVLRSAWEGGYFTLGRYLARKPVDPG